MQYFQVILTNYAKELLKSVIVYHYLRYEKQFFLRWEVPFKIFLLKKKYPKLFKLIYGAVNFIFLLLIIVVYEFYRIISLIESDLKDRLW